MSQPAASDAAPVTACTIAVIGAGTAGRAFAAACARAGFQVVLEDVMPEKLRRAQDEYPDLGSALRYAATVEDAVSSADIAIDFVPDELESKLEIFCLIDRMAPPRTVLCTPTSALSITDLASCTYRPTRCIAVSGSSLLSRELDLVRGRETSQETVDLAASIWQALGAHVRTLDDTLEPMLVKNAQPERLRVL